jgi:hypothetical protein
LRFLACRLAVRPGEAQRRPRANRARDRLSHLLASTQVHKLNVDFARGGLGSGAAVHKQPERVGRVLWYVREQDDVFAARLDTALAMSQGELLGGGVAVVSPSFSTVATATPRAATVTTQSAINVSTGLSYVIATRCPTHFHGPQDAPA